MTLLPETEEATVGRVEGGTSTENHGDGLKLKPFTLHNTVF